MAWTPVNDSQIPRWSTGGSLGQFVGSVFGDRPLNARVRPNSKLIDVCYRTTVNGDDITLAIADLGIGANANTMTIGGSYEIE